MSLRVVSVNVGQAREVRWRGRPVRTGIFKEPVAGRVAIRGVQMDGDVQADLRVHGGVHKAVYAYPVEHYAHWRGFLGRADLPYGQFGENLTVEGLDETTTAIGDVLRVGSALLQVSQPRSPCFKLGIRIGSQAFLKPFLQSRRVGFYLRVLEEGHVAAGDPIELVACDVGRVSVAEVVRLAYLDKDDAAGLRRAGGVEALTPSWREGFRQQLAKLTAGVP